MGKTKGNKEININTTQKQNKTTKSFLNYFHNTREAKFCCCYCFPVYSAQNLKCQIVVVVVVVDVVALELPLESTACLKSLLFYWA